MAEPTLREAAEALLTELDNRCGRDPVWIAQMESLRSALAATPSQEPVSGAHGKPTMEEWAALREEIARRLIRDGAVSSSVNDVLNKIKGWIFAAPSPAGEKGEPDIEFEVWVNDERLASASDETEAMRYAYQYTTEGPVRVLKATTRREWIADVASRKGKAKAAATGKEPG